MFIPSTREVLDRVTFVKYLYLPYIVCCCMSVSIAGLPLLDLTTSYLHLVIMLVHCAPFRIQEQRISPSMVIRLSQGCRVKGHKINV